ncbi:MAG TPA: gliding motility-associated C-terminal domain-containing protein [Flavipsychrobacter sp.]|nr:gliding motility-associated C-terminal domain-containing protein [Flavipsychrobacter sp.]
MVTSKRMYEQYKKILSYTILFLLCCGSSRAQKEGNVWAFGTKGGVDFNGSSPIGLKTQITSFGEGCASICDAKGQLLFYTEGSIIWDRAGNVMPNGDSLIEDPLVRKAYNPYTVTPTSSTTQGAVIVPMIDSPGKYYLFTLTSVEGSKYAGRLYYSIVDMSLRGGFGDVEPGKRAIIIDSGLTEKMTAVVGDRCDVWLLVHSDTAKLFKSYEITSSGINTTPVLSYTGAFAFFNYGLGVIKVSPNRRKIAVCNTDYGEGLELDDFDPATGIISNSLNLDYSIYYGANFSPDNSKLYANNTHYDSIYQFDISSGVASIISATKTAIAPCIYTDIKIGPDNKLYFGVPYSQYLRAITSPNAAGLSCRYEDSAIEMDTGSHFYFGLPNNLAIFVRDTINNRIQVNVCFNDSAMLHADTSGWDFVWDDGSTSEQRMVNKTGIYTVSYTSPPCIHHTDTFSVNFRDPLPEVGVYTGCKKAGNSMVWIRPRAGDTTVYTYTLTDTTGSVLLSNSKSGEDSILGVLPGVYIWGIKSANGCDTSLTDTLLAPNYNASFKTDTVVCQGDSLHITNNSHGFTSYLWNFGDSSTSGVINPVHAYAQPGVYHILLQGFPCDDSASLNVVVDTFPRVGFTLDKKAVCVGESINFYPLASFGSTLIWNFGDGSSSELWPVIHAFDVPGTFTVTETTRSQHCPDTSFRDTITVYPYPQVNLGADTSICPGDASIVLVNQFSEPLSYSNLWSTGDTVASISVNTPAFYWLMVTSDHGCVAGDTVAVNPNCYIGIPNAFSPNGDGINDYFFPRELLSRGIIAFQMSIFDRWGVKIFETDNTDGRGWDGKFNGIAQPPGVYIYMIEVAFKNEVKQNYKGNVTLISTK